jgi:hypothetical protein
VRTHAGHLRRWDPRRQEVNASTNVLWHAQCCCESIDCSGRMCKDRELVDFEMIADNNDVVYSQY